MHEHVALAAQHLGRARHARIVELHAAQVLRQVLLGPRAAVLLAPVLHRAVCLSGVLLCGWRLAGLLGTSPLVFSAPLVYVLHETPRWSAFCGDSAGARSGLTTLRGEGQPSLLEAELAAILAASTVLCAESRSAGILYEVWHAAAATGHADAGRALLAAGASADAVDAKGRTPLQLALGARHREVADTLRAALGERPASRPRRVLKAACGAARPPAAPHGAPAART